MRVIGERCHELRVRDESHSWRIFYRVDSDVILILAVHDKKTGKVPPRVLETCRARADRFDRDARRRQG